MAFYKYFLTTSCLLSLTAFAAPKMEKKDNINGVSVASGKHNSTRLYQGSINKKFSYPLLTVKNSIVNFDEKCNNAYKDKRKYTDKNKTCKHHNDNLVETIIVKEINQTGWTKAPNETERYVLGRQVYNRGSFGFYEMIQVFESKNAQDQKTMTIVQTMLTHKQTKLFTKPLFERDSAFDTTVASFTLTEVGPNETTLSYEYNAETEHWILNKEVSVPQVFSSISKSINDLVKTLEDESSIQTRDLASN